MMLLYRLAKWMEERENLTRKILDSQGDVSQFIQQKELVEKQLLAHAGMLGESSPGEPNLEDVSEEAPLPVDYWESEKEQEIY